MDIGAVTISKLIFRVKRSALARSVSDFSADHSGRLWAGVGAILCGLVIIPLTASRELQSAALFLMTAGCWMGAWALPKTYPDLVLSIFPEVQPTPARKRANRARPSGRFSPLIEVTPYRKVAALLLLSILVLLYNPFVAIDGQIKFAILIGIVCGAVVWADAVPAFSTMRSRLLLPLFFTLYAVAALRMNHLDHDPAFNYQKAAIQPIVCLFLFWAALHIARRVGIRFYLNAVAIVLGAVCLALLANYRFLIDPPAYSPVGDFTFDSYQQVSTVFGIVGIVCFVRGLEWRRGSAIRWAAFYAFLVCALVVLITPARGELVAFVAVVAIVTFPRLFIGIAGAAAVSLPAIIGAMSYYGLPSVERFQIALDLGWQEPRVVLVLQSLSLLANDGATWLIGGGADHFQKFYQLPEAMHPHNFVLEAWVSGGIVLAAATILIFVVPVVAAYARLLLGRRVPVDVFAVALFILILAAKSTAFTSNWLLALALPLFVHLRQSMTRTARQNDA